MTNAEFAEKDLEFREACKRAGIPATKREASKYRNRNGLAWWLGRNGRPLDIRQDFVDTISQE